MAIKKANALSATGAGSAVVITKGWAQVTGTWTGTINLQNDVGNDDTWVNATDETGTALAWTGNFSCPIDNSTAIRTRLYFTRTTGTANTLLSD